MRQIVFILLLYPYFCVGSLQYGLDAKREGNDPVRRVQIFSERCSGSTYLECLLKQNLSIDPILYSFGHKHFPPWFSLPRENYFGPSHFYTFEGSEDCLFVVLFRNPYDWVRSLHEKPHHSKVAGKFTRRPLRHFIRSRWVPDWEDETFSEQYAMNPLLDCNPVDGSLFPNVLCLRTEKIKTMLMIKERVQNIYYVNYEVLSRYPQEVLQEIATLFEVERHSSFRPVMTYKGLLNRPYVEKEYEFISSGDLEHINAHLDQSLERSIGYRLVEWKRDR